MAEDYKKEEAYEKQKQFVFTQLCSLASNDFVLQMGEQEQNACVVLLMQLNGCFNLEDLLAVLSNSTFFFCQHKKSWRCSGN